MPRAGFFSPKLKRVPDMMPLPFFPSSSATVGRIRREAGIEGNKAA